MLSENFRLKEEVQVLDPATKRWEPACILGFVNDWKAKIKYLNWGKTECFEVEERYQQADRKTRWGIRKVMRKERELLKRSDRRQNQNNLTDWLEKRCVGDSVKFIQNTSNNCDGIPPMRNQESDTCSNLFEAKIGKILMNDPFMMEMLVQIEGQEEHDEGIFNVKYEYLRDPQQPTKIINEAPTRIIYEDHHENPQQGNRRRSSTKRMSLAQNNEDPQQGNRRRSSSNRMSLAQNNSIDEWMSQLSQKIMTDQSATSSSGETTSQEDRPMIVQQMSTQVEFIPCMNGILKKDDKVRLEEKSNLVFVVEKIRFYCNSKTVIVKLRHETNAQFTTKLPANSIILVEANYHLSDVRNPPPLENILEDSFLYLCAIKRSIGLAAKKATNNKQYRDQLRIRSDLPCQMLGFTETKTVSFSISFLNDKTVS